jgi:hypothetical protein
VDLTNNFYASGISKLKMFSKLLPDFYNRSMKILTVLGSLFFIIGFSTRIHAQSHSDSLTNLVDEQMRLDHEIERFNDDTDYKMKCMFALKTFRSEFEKNPENAMAALYVAKAFDNIASIGRFCDVSDSLFPLYSDSSVKYFRLADKLQPGIR